MTKIFEDFFSEYQADMVSICLEYVDDKADKIYIYCAKEENTIYCDFFYKISGEIVDRNCLNDLNNGNVYNTSSDRQFTVLGILLEDMEKVSTVCSKYQQEIPTEIRLIYDVNSNQLQAQYNYDHVITGTELIPEHIFNQWFNQIKNEEAPASK